MWIRCGYGMPKNIFTKPQSQESVIFNTKLQVDFDSSEVARFYQYNEARNISFTTGAATRKCFSIGIVKYYQS